jgi:RimJ/RimL family protein N-acetyltransferase
VSSGKTHPLHFEDVRIEASRVRLRPLAQADAPALFEMFRDPEVVRYWSRPAMRALDEARVLVEDILQGYRDGTLLQIGVERRADQALLGTCTLYRFDWSNRRAEIGYALGRPYWGRGWMHEALVALIEYAFVRLDLRRLEADIDPQNAASARSLVRLGFQLEGLLRERWQVDGVVSDSGIYGLLRGEWQRGQLLPAEGG